MTLKKNILAILILGCWIFPSISWAITPVEDIGSTGHSRGIVSATDHQEIIYLLSWSDNFLVTTKGTISTIGVKIVDHADVNREELERYKKLPIVKFSTKNNQIIQVDVYPPR